MKDENLPQLSVIITTAFGYDSIRTTIEHLNKQTVREAIEVIIIAPPGIERPASAETELEDFYNTIIIEADIDNELYQAWVDAVHQSSAPVVAFGENHAFPEPVWAEALVEAHKGPWAAVGCIHKNANPHSLRSWAQLFMTYGPWTEPLDSGEVNDLPGHNSSYKRSVLIDYGSELGHKLIRTNIMHMDLRSRGYRLYFESGAKVQHINITKTKSILLDLFYNGQLYTAALALHKKWPLSKRILNASLEPLIMLKYFRGTLQNIRRAGYWGKLMPQALPIIVSGLTAHFLGKLWGYTVGFGSVQQQINDFEFDRFKHLIEKDRRLLSSR
ncbi:MAG: glycosyltransferase [Deltaproteobacteria bacterium]